MRIGVTVSISRMRRRSGVVPSIPPEARVYLNDFSKDKTLFDQGFVFGRNYALVPISGTGTAGMTIQARAFSQGDGGSSSTAWVDVAVVQANGTWAAVLQVPVNTWYYKLDIRNKAVPAAAARSGNAFGVGNVIAIWGQSEPDQITSLFHSQTTAPAMLNDDACQIIIGAQSGIPSRHFITTAAPYTASVAAMMNTFLGHRPNEKFCVIFQTFPGTDPRDLVYDGTTERQWANDKAVHDFATADGQHVGIAGMSWFAGPRALALNYGAAMLPLFSGKTSAGATITFPATITHPGGSFPADHWFGELYNYSHTKWAPYGPHRFDITEDMQNAVNNAAGVVQAGIKSIQDCREGWRAMLSHSNATMFLPMGIEPTTYVNGYDNGAGGWTDTPHPAGASVDGQQRWAKLTAHAIMRSAGLTTYTIPEFNQCYWEPTGAYVEVWSSAGAVSTTRLANAEAALPATYPHWTGVAGFQVNNLPATNATIVAGRVRIVKAGGFVSGDTITFGMGGAGGMIKFPQDYTNALWKNLPIVNVGAYGLEGIPVRPMPSASVLANTLVPANPVFTTAIATPTWFLEPVATGVFNTGTITAVIDSDNIVTPASSSVLFQASAGNIILSITNTRALRLTVKDSTPTTFLNSVQYAAIPGGPVKIILSVDLPGNKVRVWVNGVVWVNETIGANTGIIAAATRQAVFLGTNTGTLVAGGVWKKLAVWKSAVSTAVEPSTNLVKSIVGPASAAIASGWKNGADPT